MDSPWEKAYERRKQVEPEGSAAQGQSAFEGAGVMGAVGFMIAGTLAPMAAKRGLKAGVKAIGRSKKAQKSLSGIKSAMGKSDDLSKSIASTEGTGNRVLAAAARQEGSGSANLGQFAKDVGTSRVKDLQSGAKEWRSFKQKEGSTLGNFFQQSGERQTKLLGSAADSMKLEQAIAAPSVYAVDSQAGVTGPPGEQPAATDVAGHAQEFIEYMPTYATYEMGAKAGFMAAGAAGAAVKSASKALQNKDAVANAISKSFKTVQNAARRTGRETEEIANRYNQQVKNAGNVAETARRANKQVKGYAKGAKKRATQFLDQRLGSGAETPQRPDKSSATLAAVRRTVGERDMGTGAGVSDFEKTVKQTTAGDEEELARITDAMTVNPEDRSSKGFLGKLFGGKDVSLKELEDSGIPIADEAQTNIDRIKSQMAGARQNIRNEMDAGDSAAKRVLGKDAERLKPGNIRVSGYSRIGGKVMRMPDGSDVRRMATSAMERGTQMYIPGKREGVSAFNVAGGQLAAARPTVAPLKGGMDVNGDLNYFGSGDGAQKAMTKAASRNRRGGRYDRGFAVMDSPGSFTGRIIKQGGDASSTGAGSMQSTGSMYVAPQAAKKATKMQMRKHSDTDDPRSQAKRFSDEDPNEPASFLGRRVRSMKDSLSLGQAQGSQTGLREAMDWMSQYSPRRLFAKESDLWNSNLSMANREEGVPVADAAFATQQARVNATDAYTRRDAFEPMARQALKEGDLSDFGGISGILNKEEQAFKAARSIMEETNYAGGDEALKSPSWEEARKIISEANGDPSTLKNNTGTRRGQTLRRFIFEQGALGPTQSSTKNLDELQGTLSRMAKEGGLSKKAAAEAKAGLVNLEIQKASGERIKSPYKELHNAAPDMGTSDYFSETMNTLRSRRSELEEFAGTRDPVDTAYHRQPHSSPDTFGAAAGTKNAGTFAMSPTAGNFAKLGAETGLDTTRRVLSQVGMGWDPGHSASTKEGLKEIGKTWGNRAMALVGASAAYRAADTITDLALPDDAPMGEGITSEFAEIAANSRIAAANIYESMGITDGAAYVEGLMPKSMSSLPGGAVGYWAAGWKGGVMGAMINRAAQTTMKNTPLEAFSILPPLAPFVSDMTESAEEVEAKYKGDEWVPVRKGRNFFLSSTPFSGGRITQYRPNWYAEHKAQADASPTKFGSKAEQAIHEDLPLIDFAPGDLVDPHYTERKNQADRPYVSPDVPFSEVPLVGPALGATVGKAYLAAHPRGSNRPRNMDKTMGTYEGEPLTSSPNVLDGARASGTTVSGAAGIGSRAQVGRPSQVRSHPTEGGAYVDSRSTVSGGSARAVADEQFYRLTEAMGLAGFGVQQAAGGEGVFQDRRFASASEIDSTGRAFHDMAKGDMLGVGEAMRRLHPFERGGEKVGPRNTMPEWMSDDKKFGDPYCLHPETMVSVDAGDGEELWPAERVHDAVKEGREVKVRSRTGLWKDIEAAESRQVDEEIVDIEFEGTPWTLSVTKGHPIFVDDGTPKTSGDWVLAGEIEEGDPAVEPVCDSSDTFDVEVPDARMGDGCRTQSFPLGGEMVEAIIALTQTGPPSDGNHYYIDELTPDEKNWVLEAFGLSYSKRAQRLSSVVAEVLRRLDERGMHDELIGASRNAVLQLIDRFGEVEPEKDQIRLDLTTDVLGADDQETLDKAVYVVHRILCAALVPCKTQKVGRGYTVTINGTWAGRALFSPYTLQSGERRTRKFSGERNPGLKKSGNGPDQGVVIRPVESVEERKYEGPVYAFQVSGRTSSFVAAGVATHNSQIKKGEVLMPGEGLEQTGAVGNGRRALEADDLGGNTYDTAMRMLGIRGETTTEKRSSAKEMVARRMKDVGAAVRTEAVYADEERRMVGVADAATKSNRPIEIKALSNKAFAAINGPRRQDAEQLNALIGAAGKDKGMIAYANQQTGEVKTYTQNFSQRQYEQSLQKLRSGRSMAEKYAEKGYGSPGAMYSPTDRMRVLMNAGTFSDAFQREKKKAKALYHGGGMQPEERREFEKITEKHDKMRLPFEMHNKRFSGTASFTDPKESHINLSYNDNVEAAANYSAPERAIGAVYEMATSLRTPVHTKFMGNYSPKEQYERKVNLERDFQSWGSPIEDFAEPYAHGLAEADDPVQGTLSYGLGGLTFGGPAAGAIGGVIGAMYGASRGAYEAAGGDEYVPGERQEVRQQNQRFDRLKYYRAKRMYDATGGQQYLDQMQETAIGWTRQGMEGRGWAKKRRRSYSPDQRNESELYSGDQGFGSPWKGGKLIRKFSDALTKHDDTVLSLGNGSKKISSKVGQTDSTLKGAMKREFGSLPSTKQSSSNIVGQKLKLDSAPAVAENVSFRSTSDGGQEAAESLIDAGLSESGFAKKMRQENTAVAGNLGFGSPWQGQSAVEDIDWHGADPTQGQMPPELLTAFSAAPGEETDFVRPFMLTQNPEEQRQIMELVSPDMAAMMDVGWNYLHGQKMKGAAADMDPMTQVDMEMSAHPVMGMGANMEGYRIRTMEDLGLDKRDAGLGRKEAQYRMNNAVVEPSSLGREAEGVQRGASSPEELRRILMVTLSQMGVNAEVNVKETNGQSEIHFHQST